MAGVAGWGGQGDPGSVAIFAQASQLRRFVPESLCSGVTVEDIDEAAGLCTFAPGSGVCEMAQPRGKDPAVRQGPSRVPGSWACLDSEATNFKQLINRGERVKRIQQLYYPRILRHRSVADLPIPPPRRLRDQKTMELALLCLARPP